MREESQAEGCEREPRTLPCLSMLSTWRVEPSGGPSETCSSKDMANCCPQVETKRKGSLSSLSSPSLGSFPWATFSHWRTQVFPRPLQVTQAATGMQAEGLHLKSIPTPFSPALPPNKFACWEPSGSAYLGGSLAHWAKSASITRSSTFSFQFQIYMLTLMPVNRIIQFLHFPLTRYKHDICSFVPSFLLILWHAIMNSLLEMLTRLICSPHIISGLSHCTPWIRTIIIIQKP